MTIFKKGWFILKPSFFCLQLTVKLINIYHMKSKEDLIYNLIFTKENEYVINMADYIKKIYKYEDFITEVKKVLLKSKVMVVSEEVEIINESKEVEIFWRIKVKK